MKKHFWQFIGLMWVPIELIRAFITTNSDISKVGQYIINKAK